MSRPPHLRVGCGLGLFTTLVLLLLFSASPSVVVATPEARSYGHVVAISLGSSYSSVGVFAKGAVNIPAEGQSFSLSRANRRALHSGLSEPLDVLLFQPSRLLCCAEESEYFLSRAFPNPKNGPGTHTHDGRVAIAETLPLILGRLKATADQWLGQSTTHVVIAVPRRVRDDERRAIREAAESVGLSVLRLLPAPRAAGLAFGLDDHQDERVGLVVEMGRRHFEVSLLGYDWGVFEDLADVTDTALGEEMGNFIQGSLPTGSRGSEDPFGKALAYMELVIREAGLTRGDVDDIVLVGEYARDERARSPVRDFFGGRDPLRCSYGADGGCDPDEAVTMGAAVSAKMYTLPRLLGIREP
ncbi:heat shock protein 70 [Colletotrichum tabaci]|uniref:Heat shock protein 70 n=1 Tax=Colletotrichum tabaci TaxID=1209068 RepID=A0AAV9T9B6_9PEZI